MSDVVIKVENLGKKYIIGHQSENGSYLALRDVIMQNARGLWQKTKDLTQGRPIISGDNLEEVWALKDVNFEVRQGEVLGIIGRNGAGKSTLLKVLSRITEPSTGRVTIKGRVASLLEVGTGFHPELTGRENVYLNGAILGMTRQEVKRKFDEIVNFAEVEKFLDTPVKRYSSGMYVRLAFAVAAHLEPEILVVDEVLAVGDIQFQQKCLGKMNAVAKEGRTILFVSHNMEAIQRICQTAILIEQGQVISSGTAREVIRGYLDNSQAAQHLDRQIRMSSPFSDIDLEIDGQSLRRSVVWKSTESHEVTIIIKSEHPVGLPRIDIAFYRTDYLKLFAIRSDQLLNYNPYDTRQSWKITFNINALSLAPQTMFLDIGVRRDVHGSYYVLWNRAADIIIHADGDGIVVAEDSILLPQISLFIEPALHG